MKKSDIILLIIALVYVIVSLTWVYYYEPPTEPVPELVIRETVTVPAPSAEAVKAVTVTPTPTEEPVTIKAAVEDPEEEETNDEETGAEEEYPEVPAEEIQQEPVDEIEITLEELPDSLETDEADPDSEADRTDSDVFPEVQEDAGGVAGEYLGTWTITAYCGCYQCCGDWAGSPTASGAWPSAWHTVAADLPFGTVLYIEGLGTFVVEDRGVYGEWIDIYFDDHYEADSFGMQYREVWLVE